MSLHKYGVDFSHLTEPELSEVIKKIENISWDGLFWYIGQQYAHFFIEESFDISQLQIPDSCHLKRLP